jgi:hypothetical protein
MITISWRHGKVEAMMTFNMKITIPKGSKYHVDNIVEVLRNYYGLKVEVGEVELKKD